MYVVYIIIFCSYFMILVGVRSCLLTSHVMNDENLGMGSSIATAVPRTGSEVVVIRINLLHEDKRQHAPAIELIIFDHLN
jgi:hypothetical protein